MYYVKVTYTTGIDTEGGGGVITPLNFCDIFEMSKCIHCMQERGTSNLFFLPYILNGDCYVVFKQNSPPTSFFFLMS